MPVDEYEGIIMQIIGDCTRHKFVYGAKVGSSKARITVVKNRAGWYHVTLSEPLTPDARLCVDVALKQTFLLGKEEYNAQGYQFFLKPKR